MEKFSEKIPPHDICQAKSGLRWNAFCLFRREFSQTLIDDIINLLPATNYLNEK